MNSDRQLSTRMIDSMGERFRQLIGNLVQGNEKRARRLAEVAQREIPSMGQRVVIQTLIEEMAQTQAMRNSLINSPSIVPGIGTVLSFWLISVEDFFLLDQSVTLVLALCILHGVPMDESQAVEDFIIQVIGEVYGIRNGKEDPDADSISRDLMTKKLPQKYVDMGLNRGLHRFVRRILPFKRRSRLLPVGFGLMMSAYHAYNTIVSVGRLSLKYMPRLKLET
ncbi:MAG TPA: hypothetical protein PLV78_15005 [Deltaproteobacteria bacterium]|nr:hypothetical protein [Deltaproteobacteria bacterium]